MSIADTMNVWYDLHNMGKSRERKSGNRPDQVALREATLEESTVLAATSWDGNRFIVRRPDSTYVEANLRDTDPNRPFCRVIEAERLEDLVGNADVRFHGHQEFGSPEEMLTFLEEQYRMIVEHAQRGTEEPVQ